MANQGRTESGRGECARGTRGHAIIAGFGLPGREVARVLQQRGLDFCVIEMNTATVERCQIGGLRIIEGDVCDEQTLLRAGIAEASLLVLSVPSESIVLSAIQLAHRLNPRVRIIARCQYTSGGMIARQNGAEAVVVAEQVVAEELKGLVWERLEAEPLPGQTTADNPPECREPP